MFAYPSVFRKCENFHGYPSPSVFMRAAVSGVNERRRSGSVPTSAIGVTWPIFSPPKSWHDAHALAYTI